MTAGFDILAPARWSNSHKGLITKYFKGAHKEWNKAKLQEVRNKLRDNLLKAQKNCCAYCRREISHDIGHNEIDHIIAKAILGMNRFTYERMNLVAACKRCNKIKDDNPVLSGPLPATSNYPMLAADYRWIHPYIHRYSEHLKIRENIFFEYAPTADAAALARAEAVMRICKLKEIETVEKRRAGNLAKRAPTDFFAILEIIGRYPSWDDKAVARAIKKREAMKAFDLAQLQTLVSSVRAKSMNAFEQEYKKMKAAATVPAGPPLGP